MATSTKNLNINGKKVVLTTDLNSGAYTATYNGKTIGTGSAADGGALNFSGGDAAAQKELVGFKPASGSQSRFNTRNLQKQLRSQVKSQVESANIKNLNENADKTQRLNLRDLGYKDQMKIDGVNTESDKGGSSGGSSSGGGSSTPNSNSQSTNKSTPSIRGGKPGGSGANLVFPLAQPVQMDFVQFKAYEYQPLGAAGNSSFGAGQLSRMSERLMDKSEKFTVTLPIQQSVNDTNVVGWGEDKLNFAQAALAGGVMAATSELGGGSADFKPFMDRLGNTLANAKNDPTIKQYIAAEVAKSVTGSDVFTRSTGLAANNNLTLLFQGPSLRGFAFQFTLTPNSAEESKVVKEIVREFKKAMAPGVTSQGLFLQSPDVFKIGYYNAEGQPHPFLNRFKPLALTNMAVNYTPNNQYTTYGDSGMIQYQLNLTFKEIDPIYAEDYDAGEGSEGMGF